jgi:acyl-CoA thioesterase
MIHFMGRKDRSLKSGMSPYEGMVRLGDELGDVRRAVSQSNFSTQLDLSVDEIGPNFADCSIPLKTEFLNAYGTVHGGVYYSLADSTGAAALMGIVGTEVPVATIEGKLNYMASVEQGETDRLYCRANLLHMGKQTAVVEAEVSNQSDNKLCKGLFTYSVKKT